MTPNKALVEAEEALLKHPPVKLNDAQRVNARTNHVHSVVSARGKPEPVMNAFKAYATRHLRETGLLPPDIKPWSRHGSTPYLWTPEDVDRAVDYVINGQGDEPFELKAS